MAYASPVPLTVDDLLCPTCSGYVHPFLEACPACGTARPGRLDEATGGPLGAAALVDGEATRLAVRAAVVRYSSIRSGGMAPVPLLDGLEVIAGAMSYRAEAVAEGPTEALPGGPARADPADVVVSEASFTVTSRAGGAAVAEVPLAAVLAATPISRGRPAPEAWAGVRLRGRQVLAQRPIEAADLLVTFGTPGAAGQLGLRNRGGPFVRKGRPDHYTLLARWLGMLAAAAAEARWTAVGPAGHAAELGLGDAADLPRPAPAAGAAAGLVARPGEAGGETTAPPRGGVRAALEELESLRAAGLVTAGEYEQKRAEILGRL